MWHYNLSKLTILKPFKSAQLNSQMIINGLIVSLPGLERSLQGYLQSGTEEPFNMKTVPVMAVKEEPEKKVAAKKKEPNKQDQIQSPVLFLLSVILELGLETL